MFIAWNTEHGEVNWRRKLNAPLPLNPLYESKKRSYHFGSYVDVYQRQSTELIHSAVCLEKRPPPLPERVPHRTRSSSSSSSFKYPPLTAYLFYLIFPSLPYFSLFFFSLTHFRRQLIRKVWQIHLAFLLLVFCRISSPNWPYVIPLHFSHDRSNWSSSFSSIIFQIFQLFPIQLSKCSIFSTIQGCNTVELYQCLP